LNKFPQACKVDDNDKWNALGFCVSENQHHHTSLLIIFREEMVREILQLNIHLVIGHLNKSTD